MATPTPRARPFRNANESHAALERFVGRIDEELAHVQEEYAAKYNVAQRMQALRDGDALPGNPPKFPIKDQADMDNAARLKGNGDVPQATVERHMKKQATKHGLKLPASMTS